MSRRTFDGVISLKRWRTRMSWRVESAFLTVREWLAAHTEERRPRANTVKLDVEPLEIRQLPSFGLSLFSSAVADPIQGSFTAVGRSTVGVDDGDMSVNVPLEF